MVSSDLEKSLVTVAKGAGIVFFGMVLGSLFGMVNQVLLGRILGPEKYGLFNLGFSIIMIFSMFTAFGLRSALLQFVPHYMAVNKNDKVIGGILFVFKFSLLTSILLSLSLFFLSPVIARDIFHNENLEIVLKIMSIALPFVGFCNNGEYISRAFKKARYYVYLNTLLLKITQISIFIILVFLGYKLQGALAGYIIGVIFVSIAYLYIIFRKFVPSLNCDKKDVHIKKELFSIGWPLFFAGFSYLFIHYTDRIILGIYKTASDVGIYTAAFSIASIALFILPSFAYIFLPTISELCGKKDIIGIKKMFIATSKWIFLLTFPLVIYVVFYSKNIILLLYGTDYTQGSLALTILLFGIAMNGLTGMTGNVLIGIRKTKLNLIAEIIGAISNIGLNILLIPKFGILGAAIGTSISITLRNLASLWFVYKEIKIQPYDRSYLKIICSSVVTLSAISFLLGKFVIHKYQFLVVIPIFLVLYFISLYITKSFNDYDKMIIKKILIKIGFKKWVR